MAENRVFVAPRCLALQTVGETLQENTVDAVVTHPLKMPHDGFAIATAEDFRRAPIRMPETCCISLVGIKF